MTLNDLGLKHRTDKNSEHHNYLDTYETYLSRFKDKDIVLVDAVGGYEFSDRGGESLRMWSEFFPKAKIIGIDLYEKKLSLPSNVMTIQCSQDNSSILKMVFLDEGCPDIFIDDFSHVNDLSIKTFEICFPFLKSGGVYIVEDIESFAYPHHGFGGTHDYNDMNFPHILNYFRKMLNELNAKFIAHFTPSEIGKQIQSIHFYTNCIIIIKK
jgi:hypothetical protein